MMYSVLILTFFGMFAKVVFQCGILLTFLLQAKVTKVLGHAKFTGEKSPHPVVEVDGKKFTAPHILIATGEK